LDRDWVHSKATNHREQHKHRQELQMYIYASSKIPTPWYVPNTIIRRDLHMPTVKEEICTYSSQDCDDSCPTICLLDSSVLVVIVN
jgi:hypothetical protein